MRRKLCAKIVVALALWLAGFAQSGKMPQAEKPGYRFVNIEDEAIIRFMANRIMTGLEQQDPYVFLGLLADDYEEVPAVLEDGTGYILGKSGQQNTLATYFSDQANFLKKWGKPVRARGEFASLKMSNMLAQGDEFTTMLEASKIDGEIVARISLIQRLHKNATVERLDRKLFKMLNGAALFAKIEQHNTAPYFDASYVQLVTDPAWNRIVYGDYQKRLKSYKAAETGVPFKRPYGIAVDARSAVYVADTGNSRVVVLKLTGSPEDLSLLFLTTIGEPVLSQPTELAWDDRGTIEDAADDILWVVDSGNKAVYAFHASLASKKMLLGYKEKNLQEPAAVAVGRFNGRSDGNIYFVDNRLRQINRFYFDGSDLRSVDTWQAPSEMYATALATDHWGNVYLADQSSNEIRKFSPGLELLASFNDQLDSFRPVRFQTLFGSIKRAEDAAPLWSGYDQAFVLEQWTANTGTRRFELGFNLQIDSIRLSRALDRLIFVGKVTDPVKAKFFLVPVNGNALQNVGLETYSHAGRFDLNWDRRFQDGRMIA